MTYTEYCKIDDPNAIPGSFAAQQRLARYERDYEVLPPADREADPQAARVYLCISHACSYAVELAVLSRHESTQPGDMIARFVRLEAFCQELEKRTDAVQSLLRRWPKTPGLMFGVYVASSTLEMAQKFSLSVYNATRIARAVHRIPSNGRPYDRESAVEPYGPHIVAWHAMMMKELREKTMPPDIVWPKGAHLLAEGRSLLDKVYHESLGVFGHSSAESEDADDSPGDDQLAPGAWRPRPQSIPQFEIGREGILSVDGHDGEAKLSKTQRKLMEMLRQRPGGLSIASAFSKTADTPWRGTYKSTQKQRQNVQRMVSRLNEKLMACPLSVELDLPRGVIHLRSTNPN